LPEKVYAWLGKGANEFERSIVSTIYKRIVPDSTKELITINEGEEPETFWQALGGKAQYSDQPSLAQGING